MTPELRRRLQRICTTFNARARKLHAPGVVDIRVLVAVAASGQCHYCDIEVGLEHGSWDHMIPLSEGGANTITNIVRCCTTCQRSKFTKTPAQHQANRELMVKCARPTCHTEFKPRWAERQRGMARFCSHQCAGAARGQGWT